MNQAIQGGLQCRSEIWCGFGTPAEWGALRLNEISTAPEFVNTLDDLQSLALNARSRVDPVERVPSTPPRPVDPVEQDPVQPDQPPIGPDPQPAVDLSGRWNEDKPESMEVRREGNYYVGRLYWTRLDPVQQSYGLYQGIEFLRIKTSTESMPGVDSPVYRGAYKCLVGRNFIPGECYAVLSQTTDSYGRQVQTVNINATNPSTGRPVRRLFSRIAPNQ
jgi:hypothetical protein